MNSKTAKLFLNSPYGKAVSSMGCYITLDCEVNMCEDLFKVLVEFLGTENVEIRYPNALEETVPDMLSSDYKRRFKAEYQQLRYRYHKLCRLIRKAESGQVKTDCSIDLLKQQRKMMYEYLNILSERSVIEDIEII